MSEGRKARARRKRGGNKAPAPRPAPALVYSLVGAGVAAALALAALLFVYPARPGPGTGRGVELVLPGDESAEALGARLAAAGLVTSPRLFALYVRARGGAAVVRGAHLVSDDLAPGALLERLERDPHRRKVKVTLPEGWTRFDMARRLEGQRVCGSQAFLDATVRPALLAELQLAGEESAEGYLFPATYDLAPDTDAAEVVRRLKAEADKRFAALEARYASNLLDLGTSLGFSRREIVILASLVEKEAVVDDERPLIASVFLNRLRDPAFHPKLLQSDPTAAYACAAEPARVPTCAGFTGKVTHALLVDPSNRYSTYRHEGLPPGPIANPGQKSLAAVLTAPPSRFLYFVAKGEGRHTFSETYAAHMAAIRAGSTKGATPPSE